MIGGVNVILTLALAVIALPILCCGLSAWVGAISQMLKGH